MQTPGEVDGYRGRTKATEHRHVIELDKVLAQYDFRGGEWQTECCYGHDHARGYIVESLCGLVLAIGHDCGDTWIEGMKAAAQHIERVNAYHGARLAIDHIIKKVPTVLPSREEAAGMLAFRRAFGQRFPQIADAARNDDPLRFYGTPLWRTTPPNFDELHDRWTSLKADRSLLHPTSATREVTRLKTRFVELEEDVRVAREWFDKVTPFLSLENLSRVIDMFKISATVENIEDEGVVMTMGADKGERPMQFSLRRCGLREKPV